MFEDTHPAVHFPSLWKVKNFFVKTYVSLQNPLILHPFKERIGNSIAGLQMENFRLQHENPSAL